MRVSNSICRAAFGALACAVLLLGPRVSVSAQESGRPAASPALRAAQDYRAQASDITGSVDRIDDQDLALLANPDLDSPRATIVTFRDSIERAYRILTEAYDAHRTSAGFGVDPDVADKVKTAELLLRRAVATIDLSQVPDVNREKVGVETALLLKEILDRLPLPPLQTIPDAEAVRNAPENKPVTSWVLPFTDLSIVKVASGPQAGQFLFAPNTVTRAEEFYKVVKTYADRAGAGSDFFEFYTLTPGDLLPPKWYLWIEELPEWTRKPFMGQTVWQWTGLFLVLAVLFGALFAFGRYRRRQAVSISAVRRTIGKVVMPVLTIAVAALAWHIIGGHLNITGLPYVVANTVLHAAAYLAAAWLTYQIFLVAAEFIISSPRIDPMGIDASLLRITARVLGIAAAVAMLFYGATTIGVPVYGVVAGLGVGGLALGLAARPTLENLIGGLILYADRPVRVGDFCKFGEKMGTVEEIGLRSTRIRAPDRTLITVPNAEFSNKELINFTRRDQSLMNFTLGLRYETPTAKLNEILTRLRDLLTNHPTVDPETVRVRLRNLGAYSLDIEVRAYIKRADMSEFLEVQEGLLLAILDLVEDNGAEIAFPSTTNYHVSDTGALHAAIAAAHKMTG